MRHLEKACQKAAPNRGARELGELLKTLSLRTVARRIKNQRGKPIHHSQVGRYATGVVPEYPWRKAIRRGIGISVDAWDQP